MEREWIAAAVFVAAVLLWCRARGMERARLAHYSIATRIRIHLPMIPWRDEVAPSDHPTLHPIRVRARIGALLLLAVSVLTTLIVRSVEPVAPLTQPLRVIPESELISKPDLAAPTENTSDPAGPADLAEPAPEPEPLEELRSPIRLYGTARVKPIYRVHDVEGAQITHIDPNSFWAMLGVREGDVVIELHGAPVDNPAVLVELMNVLERDEHVALRVRGTDGEVRYLEFRIPGDS